MWDNSCESERVTAALPLDCCTPELVLDTGVDGLRGE